MSSGKNTVAAVCLFTTSLLASDQSGQIVFFGLPVPGATITATQGEKKMVSITDEHGIYKFSDLPDGVWTLEVQMTGFLPPVAQ